VITAMATVNRKLAAVTSDPCAGRELGEAIGGENMAGLAEAISKARAAVEGTALARSLGETLTKVQSSCKLDSVGRQLFSDAMQAFRKKSVDLVTSIVEHICDGGAAVEAEVDEAAGEISTSSFQLKQQASWSDTPARDREAIDFVAETIPIISKSAVKIMSLKTDVPTGYCAEVKVVEALESVQNLTISKPHLQYVLGDDLVEKYVAAVKQLSGILTPIHQDSIKSAVRKAAANIKKLQGMVLDESTPLDGDAFFSKCTAAKMETMRLARNVAKSSLQEVRSVLGGDKAELPEELNHADSLVTQARDQTIKYGVLAFLRNPEINLPTDTGKSLRKKLKNIWALHSVDQHVSEYLGKELTKKVDEVFRVDSVAAAPAAPKRPGGAAQDKASSGGKKRRG
jgi:hypothetical protein